MKKEICTLVIAIGLSFISISQISRNTMMVGGSGSFSQSASKEGYKYSTRLALDAKFGYFILDNLALGTSLGFNRYGKYNTSWNFTPFVRYYAKNVYLQAGYGYGQSKFKSDSSDIVYSSSAFSSELGYALFLNDNVAIEPAFFFNQYFNEGKNSGSNYGFKIGFQFYFNRKE